MFSPVILRLARRHIARRLLQSVLFVLGVALGVAVVVAIDLANGSASRAFQLSAQTVTGKATHQIIGGPSGLPTDLYRRLRADLHLREVAPVVEEYVRVTTLGSQPLHLLGVDPFSEPPFRSYLTNVSVQGGSQSAFDALNALIATPGTVLISQTMADRYNVKVGDTLTLQTGSALEPVRVVGLLQPTDDLSRQALDNLMLADIATAQELVGRPETISRIDLILPDGYDLSPIEALLPAGATLTTPTQENGTLSQMTAAFELNLQALSLLALVVGIFLIYNTVTFSVVQRRPVIGAMRALGATRSQVFGLILGEAALLGLIGTILGLGLGLIFGRAAVGLVSQTISDLYFTVNVQRVTVTPLTLLKGAGIGLAASIFAAVLPSLDATRTPPAGAMRRSEVEQQARRLLPFVTAGAVILNAIGLIFLFLPTHSLIISFIALFAVLVGGALFTPLALLGAMRISTPITDRLFGVLGRMAPRAVARSLSRTSVAVAALTVAVSVIVGVSVMIDSFRGTVSDWLDNTLGADIYVSPPSVSGARSTADVDPAILGQIQAVDGVARAATARSVSVAAPDYLDLPPVNLAAASADITQSRRRFVWYTGPTDDYFAALEAGNIMVSEPFAYRRNINPEHNILTLLTDHGAHTFTVIGVYYDYSTDQGTVFMADDVYRRYYDDPYISSVAVFLKPGADPQAVIDRLRSGPLAGTNLLAQSYASLRTNVFTIFDRAFAITIALRLLATVVAFIGILSALMALQLEHTREYGVMRAVGLTPRQLWQYTLIQTGLMGITAGVLALPIGTVLALVLIYVINVRSFGWTMQLTLAPVEYGLAFAVAVIAALAAGIYPARRLSRLLTGAALRSE